MSAGNITPITRATRREDRRRHARSRIAGRLFAIFDLLYSTAREARDCGEEYNDPLLKELGGVNHLASNSPLHEAMVDVCSAAGEMLEAAQPEDFSERGRYRDGP